MSKQLWRWSATHLAQAIRLKTVSSREVVQAHLDRINSVNSAVGAITQVLAETALAAADAADADLASGHEVGPLHGVPITVKENIDVKGSATTNGVVRYKTSVPEWDVPIIQHLKNAGAVVIGRTNMPDFGMRWHTDNALHGATINPWEPLRTPGGSSGGEAVAIATGMSPLGIGNDMGGSTRQPAVNCGIAGLRPTTGRVSRIMSLMFDDPPMFYTQIACVNGPMARKVCDLKLALGVIERPDPTDPIWISGNPPPTAKESADRVGLIVDPSGDGVAPPVAKAVNLAASSLKREGYTVEEIFPPMMEEADETIQRLAETEISAYFDDILPMFSKDSADVLRSVVGDVKPDAEKYRDAIAKRHQIASAWRQMMDQFPLVVGPVSTMEPFAVGFDTGGYEAMRQLIRSFRLTELCNLLGLPSVAVPVQTEQNLPYGVQIIGRLFDEDRCFRAAQFIERAAQLSTPIDPIIAT